MPADSPHHPSAAGTDEGIDLDEDDGGFGFTGRVDVVGGTADVLSATLVLDTCPQPSPVQTFLLQAFGNGTAMNTAFTKEATGETSFTGSS